LSAGAISKKIGPALLGLHGKRGAISWRRGKGQNRDFFVAMTAGCSIRICEKLPDGSLRAMLWRKLTKAEPRQGEEFVELLAPDPGGGFCAWNSPNRPKTAEVGEALTEFVAAVEHRHGADIWVE
jgi:hypothetical protein